MKPNPPIMNPVMSRKLSLGGSSFIDSRESEMINPSSLDSVAQAVEDVRKDIIDLVGEIKGIRVEQGKQGGFQNRLVGAAAVVSLVLFIICGVAVYHFGRWETAFAQIESMQVAVRTTSSETESISKDIIVLKDTDVKHTDRLNKQDNRIDALEQGLERVKSTQWNKTWKEVNRKPKDE
jgi:hypothetical protein